MEDRTGDEAFKVFKGGQPGWRYSGGHGERMLKQERRWIIEKIRRASSTEDIDAFIKEAMGLILRERRGKGRGRTGIDSRDAILMAFHGDPVVQIAREKRMELTGDSPDHVEAIIEKIGEDVLSTHSSGSR
jgi:hypothetical protein